MNINAIKVCKLMGICAMIYDFSIGLKIIEEEQILFCDLVFIYIQLNGQKLPISERTDATPHARLLVHLVKPSKKRFNFNTVQDSLSILMQCHLTTAFKANI